ncbi:MAG: ketoacyl-ACP synthase III, partial [Planctomycetaceae bacterium]|nr:ketoacyl-ACP synthase III [Planctomycetaceae bacterium]
LVPPGDAVHIGEPILRVSQNPHPGESNSPKESWIHKPVLKKSIDASQGAISAPEKSLFTNSSSVKTVGLTQPYCVTGSRAVDNQQILKRFKHRTVGEVSKLTGIQQRFQLAHNETVVDLAVNAVKTAFEEESIRLGDIDAIVCSTTTPLAVSPSMACSLLGALSTDEPREIPCHDVNAACAGYLYALGTGTDFLRAGTGRTVLVVTADALSSVVNPNDFDTCILFGDAALATILSNDAEWLAERKHSPRTPALTRLLRRPVLSAAADSSSALHVPFPGNGHVEMQGNRVFGKAVRKMAAMLEAACADSGISIENLDWVVPHQANGRILEALRSRMPFDDWRVVDTVGDTGNTSSTSIPLALQKLEPRIEPGQRIGLCAFGGGFAFGASIVELHDP